MARDLEKWKIAQQKNYQENKERYRDSAKKSKDKTVGIIRTFKEVPCMDCGVQYPPYVMQFDHVRGEKLFGISTAMRRVGRNKLIEEIAKCDVVCGNCHAERTFNPK